MNHYQSLSRTFLIIAILGLIATSYFYFTPQGVFWGVDTAPCRYVPRNLINYLIPIAWATPPFNINICKPYYSMLYSSAIIDVGLWLGFIYFLRKSKKV